MISYRYMSMGMYGLLSGTEAKDKSDLFVNYLMTPRRMQMDMHMLMGMYGITNRLTAMLMLNYNVNSMQMDMLSASGHNHGSSGHINHTMKTSGLGDIKIHFLYGLIKKPEHQLLLSIGASLPSGNIQVKGKSDDMMYPGKRYPYSMQLGSGTYDILPCVSYIFQRNKITFSLQGSGIIRTHYNTVGYNLGNEASANLWLAYQWLNFLSSSVRLEGNAASEISGYDPTLYYYNELSANPHNYGGKRLNGFIGSVFHFRKGFLKNNRLGIEYGIPLYQSLNGVQIQLRQTLYAAWSITF